MEAMTQIEVGGSSRPLFRIETPPSRNSIQTDASFNRGEAVVQPRTWPWWFGCSVIEL